MYAQQFFVLLIASVLPVAASSSSSSSSSNSELTVSVYEGPTECEENSKVRNWDHLEIHYTGSIDESSETGEKGYMFDSSLKRQQSFDFQIGANEVIDGWDDGIVGLCKGAKAILIIPPDKGYGSHGIEGAGIPGGATLRFDVEIININNRPPLSFYFTQLDENQDGFVEQGEIQAFIQKTLGYLQDRDGDGKVSWEEIIGYKAIQPSPSSFSANDEL